MKQQNLKIKHPSKKEYWPNTQGLKLNTNVANLFTKTKTKIYKNLPNLTSNLLPIDILFQSKRYHLFQIILYEIECIILEKITLEIDITILDREKNNLLNQLLQRSEEKFFQKCNTIYFSNTLNSYQLINYDKNVIPHVENSLEIIFIFCLFGSSNKTRNIFKPVFGERIPVLQVEVLFENFIIEVSNHFMDALLRSSNGIIFGFQNYIFDDKYYSIRKIEEFRNNLMWYKFTNHYINIPKNIYESRYSIWIMGPKGIISKNIFGHRLYELSSLSTTQLIITFILEIQDFFLPKFYNLIQILAKTIFYIISVPIKSKIHLVWKNILNDIS